LKINKPGQRFSTFTKRLIAVIYHRIFGEQISIGAQSFLKDLSLVTMGTAIMTLLTFIFGILGGRILGPEEYGKFILVLSGHDLLRIPMMLGFGTAMLKYLSETNDVNTNIKIVNTTNLLAILYTIITTIIYLLLRNPISNLLTLSSDLFYFALVTAILGVLFTISTSAQRGLGKMLVFALIQPASGIILVLGFLLYFYNGEHTFKAMAYPQMLAFGITGLIALVSLGRRYIRFTFDRHWAGILANYAFFAFITGLSSALYTNVGKFLINRYMTIADVGIFNAYYSPSLNVASVLFITFNLVFFPTASKLEDKKAILKKLDRVIPYLFGIGVPFVLILEFVVLKLYGGSYPMDFTLMLIFDITSVLVIWYGILSSIFSSEGLRGIRLSCISIGTVAVLDIVLSITSIPVLGLVGATGSIGVSFTAGIVCLYLLRNKLLQKPNPKAKILN
jgi:O-antigen/teichoic acid export membrane protein